MKVCQSITEKNCKNLLQKIMRIRESNYYNEVEVLALQVSRLIPFIDSAMKIVSRVHQALSTFI